MDAYAVKGNVIFTKTNRDFTVMENAYVVCEQGKVVDVFCLLPERYKGLKIHDFGNKLIMPGLVDLHLHAPQYAFRGLGMDLELIPWLNKYAFTEEAKYADTGYAEKKYRVFCRAMKRSATTRAAVFATIHVPATNILMDMLEETGLVTYVGKVNMDRNSPDLLIETSEDSYTDTLAWAIEAARRYKNTKPMITPRFVPSCTGALMTGLGHIAAQNHLPVQSHLSENINEIKWVKELHPDSQSYSGVYHEHGLFGQVRTIMAHCVHLTEKEMELAQDNGVFIAHCPQSNTNLASGIAPVRQMLDKGMRLGLGTDVAGGFSVSIFRAISDAIQVSKLYSALVDKSKKPVTLAEAFFMATKGGGSFWGNVGSFEPGYDMDAIVVGDEDIDGSDELTVAQRLERVIYLSPDRQPDAKYVQGESVILNSTAY